MGYRSGDADVALVGLLLPYRQLSVRDVAQWGRQCAGQYTLFPNPRPSNPHPVILFLLLSFSLPPPPLSFDRYIYIQVNMMYIYV